MSWEQVAALTNMSIKGVKNEQSFKPLAGHIWPQKVAIFGELKEVTLSP